MNSTNGAKQYSPRLSIVIASWNAARTLENCLRSVIEQEFRDWELLIVDNKSTDGTLDVIRRYERHLAWWQSRRDSGIYDAWNQAIARTKGSYVCFLGADDAWSDAGALYSIANVVEKQRPDIASAKGLLVDGQGAPLGTIGRPWNYKGIRRRMLICHPGAWFRRQIFDNLGLFDTRYRIAADYDWMLRLPAATSHTYIDRVVVHIGSGGVSRKLGWLTMLEYWKIQASHPRVGRLRATVTYLDRLWRKPVARILRLY